MGTRRAALLVAVVASAVAVPSVAWASWGTTSPGTAAAEAGTLTAPTPAFGTTTCTGNGKGNMTATIPLTWSAAGATSYDLQWDGSPAFTQPATSLTSTSTTITVDPKKTSTLYVHLRAHAGNNWLTAYGPTKSEPVTCP